MRLMGRSASASPATESAPSKYPGCSENSQTGSTRTATVAEFTVVGTWDDEGVRTVIGAIEGRHRIVAVKDQHDGEAIHEPIFIEHVEADSADKATAIFHGKVDEAMAELKRSEVPC